MKDLGDKYEFAASLAWTLMIKKWTQKTVV
jgi:hypothetical protein